MFDEKVSSPISNWDFNGSGEGIKVGLFSYIHIRVGRNATGRIEVPEKFKPRSDSAGELIGVRARRGARFSVGDLIGSLNRLNHVHLNLGPWNAQANPLALPFLGFKDTVAPTIEPNGIEVVPASALTPDLTMKRELARFFEKRNGRLVVSGDVVYNQTHMWLSGSTPDSRASWAGSLESDVSPKKELVRFDEKRNGRLVVRGDVAIVVTAYDRVDGNVANRKLGLYRIGYQVLRSDGVPVEGFEQPLMNIEFSRLPPEGSSVFRAYASGSGVSAYGTPTKFRYIVTNRVRDGEAIYGLLRTSSLASGNYIIRVVAEDYAGNRASGPSTELAVRVEN